MAGFKEMLKGLNPFSFITFDGEEYDLTTRFIPDEVIIDEAGNQDGIIVQESNDYQYAGYRAGGASIYELEQYESHCMRLCPNGYNYTAVQNGVSGFPKCQIEFANNPSMDFTKKEFTYTFLVRSNEEKVKWNYAGNQPTLYPPATYYEPILHHDGVVTVLANWGYNQGENVIIHIPAIKANNISSSGIFNINRKIQTRGFNNEASWWVVRLKNFKLEVFCDGERVLNEDIGKLVDKESFYLDGGDKTLFVGSHPTGWDGKPRADRMFRPTELDQIALFNYGLKDTDIAKLYRRLWSYDTAIRLCSPKFHYKMDEQIYSATLVNSGNAGWNALQIGNGGITNVVLNQDGRNKETKSMFFQNNAFVYSGANYTNSFVDFSDTTFTLSFNFRIQESRRGILYSYTTDTYPYNGFTIWANSNNGLEYGQSYEMQFRVDGEYLSLKMFLEPSELHNLIISRNGNYVSVFINGDKVVDSYPFTTTTNNYTMTSTFLSGQQSDVVLSGYLSQIFYLDYTLPEMKITTVCNNEKLYRVRGTVVLNGNPHVATIRVYHHVNGSLLEETKSDGQTGVWHVDLTTNMAVDMVVFDDENQNIRTRAYGRIIPYEMPDSVYIL